MTANKHRFHWGSACIMSAAVFFAQQTVAQESAVSGLVWHKRSPGSEVGAQSRLQVLDNRSDAVITSSGAKGAVAAGIGGSLDLVGMAHANALGVSALDLRQSSIVVLGNQVSGFLNAVGGSATANVALVASSVGRKPVTSSTIQIQGNRASDIDAFGGKADVLLGAGSMQLPGRASANSVLLEATEVRNSTLANLRNEARGLTSIGGSALANVTTAALSKIDDSSVLQVGNRAREIRAGGGVAGVGLGAVASADVTGVAAANSVTLASTNLRGAQLLQTDNVAENMTSTGGSALANGIHFTNHQSSSGARYQALVTNNTARNISAWGGEGSVLSGVLASVQMSAAALANTISVTEGELTNGPQHLISSNTAENVAATGGAAAANSIWLNSARVDGGSISIADNVATQVQTSGGSGSIGGGIVGAVERSSRAFASVVAADGNASLERMQLVIAGNHAQQITGTGGTAVAQSVLVSDGALRSGSVNIVGNNRAERVSATGFSAQAGGGVVASASQTAAAVANSLVVSESVVDAPSITLVGNKAVGLDARGGTVQANSAVVEAGEGAGSHLSASGLIMGNEAENISSAAGSQSAAGGLASKGSKARAAVNALVLHDDAKVDAQSPWTLIGNRAVNVAANGGTALVNSLAAYRGARVEGSTVTLAGNRAQDVQAHGGSSGVAGVGSVSQGVLTANSVYLEGQGSAVLKNSPVAIANNIARDLQAQGGRLDANSLAINGHGQVSESTITLVGNNAQQVRSAGKESTLAGAAFGGGVGQAYANSVRVLGSLRAASVQLVGNRANNVAAEDASAAANSVVIASNGSAEGLQATISANTADGVSANSGEASVNSVVSEGQASGATVQIAGNRGAGQSSGGDAAVVNSVRVRKSGSVSGSSITLAGNRGEANGGTSNSVDAEGAISGGQITILGNHGNASSGGVINSVVGKGRINGGQITVLGNRGTAQAGLANSIKNTGSLTGMQVAVLGNNADARGGGTVNSLDNSGSLQGSQITITGNSGRTKGGGTVNSVRNRGNVTGARVLIAGNDGSTTGGGTVNSVDNRGSLMGNVVISGNRGSATMGGTVNSLVNQGMMTGTVAIVGNEGRALAGGVSNSVINQGVITGAVNIVGNMSMAAAGMTSSSVRNLGGAVTGVVGVAGNTPFAANPGYTYALPPTGIVNQSVTVLPAVNLLSM